MPTIPTSTDSIQGADLDLRVAETCRAVPEGADTQALLNALRPLFAGLDVKLAMTRGGWHRLGGVVDLDGTRIADHIAEWAHSICGGDIDELMVRISDLRYFATRINGRTHYLTVQTGPAARDFVQIEVEELQEVLDRCLFDPDWLPDSLSDFVDPLDFPRLEPEPVGRSRLVFRRLVRVGDLVASGDPGPRLRRFLDDWDRSSASDCAFCAHWVLSIREYRDRDGDGRIGAKPIPVLPPDVPTLPDGDLGRGARLANRIHGFDRALGYPFAWYFHMLASTKVSHRLAEAVHDDQMGAYDYLPPRDVRVLRDWYDAPYGV